MSSFHEKPNFFVSSLHLKVEDLERSLSFYKDMIGFKVMKKTEHKALLTADGQSPLLTIEQPGNVSPKEKRTTGLYHFALLLPNRKDLGLVIKHLTFMKYPLQGGSNHGISEAVYLSDPDGNGIELYADTPPSTWERDNGLLVAKGEPLGVEGIIASAGSDEWQGLPTNTIMGHIHLHASELQKTKLFYTQGLGLDLVMKIENSALFFSTGGYHHHVALNTWNGIGASRPSNNSVGLKYYSFVLPNNEVRQHVIQQIKNLGYAVQTRNGNYMTEDPSGNQIQLIV
jgi:catechol 2,3-dioxygenase